MKTFISLGAAAATLCVVATAEEEKFAPTDKPHFDMKEVYEGSTGELVITKMDVPENCERRSKAGDFLEVHYVGKIAGNPAVTFEDTHSTGEPLDFRLGAGMVIQGWDLGLTDMCVGEHRILTVPADLAYGKQGAPPIIPGGATLVFETELVKISDENPAAKDFFTQMKDD